MKRHASDKMKTRNRRGVAVLWLILWGGMFFTFFCVSLEVTNLWLARIELKNSLDAACLAAAKEWGASGSTLTEAARNSGVTYAAANPVLGVPVVLDPNYDGSDPVFNPNQNASCDGNLIFGRINYPVVSPVTFNTSLDAAAVGVTPAVRAQATIEVQGFCSSMFGISLFDISAKSTAYYDLTTGNVGLVDIDTFNCN